jgi:formylglycine-generating enzyme required for sulfatase activity
LLRGQVVRAPADGSSGDVRRPKAGHCRVHDGSGNLAAIARLESGRLHPEPAPGAAADGPAQMFGDAWEWTGSAYLPYPGFRPLPGALGEYNGKFMCGQLVMRGGSCATPSRHIRPSYRNFFPPGARWQFAGIRLARGSA